MLGRIRGIGWRGEEAAENGRNKELYSIARTITGERRRRKVGVNDKQGVLKTSFDSVHRESMWNIMGSYGIPRKIMSVIVGIYGGFYCALIELYSITKSGGGKKCV